MADVRISALPTAQALTGTELVPVVQNGLTVQTTALAIAQSTALTSVSSFSAGATGFTPSVATIGAVTLDGVLNAANGGTGVATLSGLAYGNGTSAFTAATAAQIVSAIGATFVTNATNTTNLIGGSTGSVSYQSSANATAFLALGTTNYVLTAGASAPQYVAQSTLAVGTATTATNLASGAAGSVPYQSGAGATSMLALGTNGYVLTAGASAPAYVDQSTLSVGTATNATNSAITNDAATATAVYPTWVTANTGNLPIKVTSTKLSFVPSTGALTATGGISGGTF
jgi:hypothetical protein